MASVVATRIDMDEGMASAMPSIEACTPHATARSATMMLVLLLLTLPHRAQATATAVYSPSNVPTLKPSVSLQPTAVPTCSKDSVLEVTAPASGDLIYAGEPFEITWTSGGK